jgi:hypothetical protein
VISRRALVWAGLCAAGASAFAARGARADLPVPPNDVLAFQVLRGDSAIGTHALRFARAGDMLEVRIAVDLRVGFGPITLFRYTLRTTEQWRGGQLEGFDSTTYDNGTQDFARAVRDAQGLWVEGSKAPRYLAPVDALPSSHWNPAELNGPWINPQDGRLVRPAVARLGLDQVPAASGAEVPATHYAVSGEVQMDLWYDATPCWVALHFTAHDGSLIRYERM